MIRYWRRIGFLEKVIVLTIGFIVLLLALTALVPRDPCAMYRPCLNHVLADGMMQCTQVGEPELLDPQACAAKRSGFGR